MRDRSTEHRWLIRVPRVVAATLLVLVVPACSGDIPIQESLSPSGDPICGASKPGEQVVLYTDFGLDYWYSDVLSNFELDCAVNIYFERLAGDDAVSRLESERSAPLADIVVAPPLNLTQAADEGLLDGSLVPEAASVPDDRCDHLRRWCTLVENYTSWVYNKARVAHPPSTWDDMLAAQFAGKILTSWPDQSVDGFAALELLARTEGADAAIAYLAKLERSISAHYLVTDTISRVVSTGSSLLGNGNLQENLNDLDQYHNIGIWFPRIAGQAATTLAVPFGAALVKGARNGTAARALLDYLWSRAGQSAVGRANGAPARPDVVPTDNRSQRLRSVLGTTQVIFVDWEQVFHQQQALVSRWTAIASAPDGTAPPSSPTPQPSLPPPPPISPSPT